MRVIGEVSKRHRLVEPPVVDVVIALVTGNQVLQQRCPALAVDNDFQHGRARQVQQHQPGAALPELVQRRVHGGQFARVGS